MNTSSKNPARRRNPKQRRAQQTVQAVLDAVVRILKRHGVDAVTTNRVAEVAGVSIGSVYQYFPNKRAIFFALHDRHAEQTGRLIEKTLVEHATSSLENLIRALVGAMVDAHAPDPELYELLQTETPHRATGARNLAERLSGVLRLAIASRVPELRTTGNFDLLLFVTTNMIDALSHAAVLRRPKHLSLPAAKEETVRAIVTYLRDRAAPSVPRRKRKTRRSGLAAS
jgi:AcrR family transcriptional regulator